MFILPALGVSAGGFLLPELMVLTFLGQYFPRTVIGLIVLALILGEVRS